MCESCSLFQFNVMMIAVKASQQPLVNASVSQLSYSSTRVYVAPGPLSLSPKWQFEARRGPQYMYLLPTTGTPS